MPNYKKVKDIKDKVHKEFTQSLIKNKIPCISTGIVRDKNNKIKLLEVILDRKIRYSNPTILKKIPKTYKRIKVKAF